MNKVFKIVFNAARGTRMVVNETTSSVQSGKKAAVTVAVVGALASGAAMASIDATDSPYVFGEATEIVINKVSGESSNRYSGINAYDKDVIVTMQNGAVLTVKGDGDSLANPSRIYGVNTATGGSLTVNGSSIINLEAQNVSQLRAYRVNDGTLTMNGPSAAKITASGADILVGVDVWYGGQATFNGGLNLEIDGSSKDMRGIDSNPRAGDLVNQNNLVFENGAVNVTVNNTATDATQTYGVVGNVTSNTFKGDVSIDVTTKSGQTVGVFAQSNPVGYPATKFEFAGDETKIFVSVDGSDGKATAGVTSSADTAVVSFTGKSVLVDVESTNGSVDAVRAQYNNATIASTADDVALQATAAKGKATALYVEGKNNVDFLGSKLELKASGANAQGVNARYGAVVDLGSAETSLVSINVESNGSSADGNLLMGIQAREEGTKVTVNGQKFETTVTAKGKDTAYGVLVQGNAETAKEPTGTHLGAIVIDAENTVITATAASGSAHGLVAMAQGQLSVNGNLEVNAVNAITARGRSVVEVNKASSGKDVVLNGDINFNKGTASGTDAWADVYVTLDTAASVWNGNVKATWDVQAKADDFSGSNLNLKLANGAKWVNKDIATSGVVGTDSKGASLLAVNSLELAGGILDLSASTQDVTVKGEVSGTGTLVVDTEKSGALVNNGTDAVDLLTIETVQTADDITAEEATALKDAHTVNIDKVEVKVAEGQVAGAIVVGADGEVEEAVNTKTEALADKVWLAPNMITRIMMNDVRKRMGDLRAAEGTHGVWARYNGGQMSGSGVDADFNMIQVGIDTVPVVDAPRFGVAFSYAQTESEDNLGTTDMDSFSLAFYGTKMYDNGMFVDVIGRMATMDSDIVNAGAKGKMDNVALSLSGELGWRFDVTDRFFFEPSAELTYTYTNADTFTMTNGGKYELEAMDSLVGRAGFAAGFKCPANKGDVYVRAAVVHEFMGDATINSWTANGAATPIESDGKDTWFEYAIGAQFNVNKNTYVYADIERTEGATMDEDWRANVGVRFAF